MQHLYESHYYPVKDRFFCSYVKGWMDNGRLKDQFATLYILAVNKNCLVIDCFSGNGWQLNFRRHFNDWELNEVSQQLNLLEPHAWMTAEGIL